MSIETVETAKPVCLPEEYAKKLTRLATTFRVTESSLLQEALDLLFQRDFEAGTLEGWAYLDEMEAEFGPMPPRRPESAINPCDIIDFVGTPINPKSIRRRGETR